MTIRNRFVAAGDRRLVASLEALAGARLVFVAGLPGTGKSLVVHQLAHLAAGAGRTVHLLQWDVARPVFEATGAGRRYPVVDGVTHAVIRKAAGSWLRRAVAAWDRAHPGGADLLLGETPFVGGRFIELARRMDDAAEPVLAAATARFVVPVPSREVRAFLEAERARRAAAPLHEREREDAPPHVMRDLWRALVEVASALGIAPLAASDARREPAWDPELYGGVYAALLRHRHVDVVPLDTVLPTQALSVYDFAVTPWHVVPRDDEAEIFIEEVERAYPDRAVLEREIERWWEV